MTVKLNQMRVQGTDPRQPQSGPSNVIFEVLLRLERLIAKDWVSSMGRVVGETSEVGGEHVWIGES